MSDFNKSLLPAEAHKAKINTALKAEDKVQLFRQMVRIRAFEERAVRAYQQSHIGGFCHTYIGQESVAVGMLSLLGPDDHCITAYRDHAHAMMVGMTMNECMAELYGKYTGCSKGKGGSMHYFAPDKNYWGGHGIVGAQTPLGAGIAFALKYEDKKGACLCYLGDGAVNQGAFHEALNLAALWELPVIYVIENNRYSMGTCQARSSAGAQLAQRAEGYGMDWAVVAGNDLYAVRAQTQAALEYAHKTSRPMILEVDTYRYRGHSMSDPDQTYRTKEEIAEYRHRHDPILLFGNVLKKEKVLDEAQIESMEQAAREEAEAAAQFAAASPFPPAEEIYKDVYWETDHPNERSSQGTLYFT
ncbi:MAG TPA: pyruvate dehydrogenase (acetyl-transferring) E1 component subunit alpha [Opitutales bacterium]|nr:pyruvate dehydrogenase (acetyl-transferring) E1 component subunit alpha [Opitutales bacterium]